MAVPSEVLEAFRRADKNGTGTLAITDIKTVLLDLDADVYQHEGLSPLMKESASIAKSIDYEVFLSSIFSLKSSSSAMEEVATALSKRWLSPAAIISNCDTDDNGTISFEEFCGLVASLRVDVSGKVLADAFATLDADGSGEISASELACALNRAGENAIKSPASKRATDISANRRLVALIAHNEMKPAMLRFVSEHLDFFSQQRIVTTCSTGRTLEQKLGLKIAIKVVSGPIGGDQDIGGMISRGEVGAIFFFQDPLSVHPHWADIVALSRLADVHNVASASNPQTAAALVYALQYSADASKLLLTSTTQLDSAVVEAYHARQKKAIATAVAAKTEQCVK